MSTEYNNNEANTSLAKTQSNVKDEVASNTVSNDEAITNILVSHSAQDITVRREDGETKSAEMSISSEVVPVPSLIKLRSSTNIEYLVTGNISQPQILHTIDSALKLTGDGAQENQSDDSGSQSNERPRYGPILSVNESSHDASPNSDNNSTYMNVSDVIEQKSTHSETSIANTGTTLTRQFIPLKTEDGSCDHGDIQLNQDDASRVTNSYREKRHLSTDTIDDNTTPKDCESTDDLASLTDDSVFGDSNMDDTAHENLPGRPTTGIQDNKFTASPTRCDEMNRQRSDEEVLDFFNEAERSFNEQFLDQPRYDSLEKSRPSLPILKPSKAMARSQSTAPTVRPSLGLDHLDNLCRIMESLVQLREENQNLKKKCSYLQDTQEILKARSDVMSQQSPLDGAQTFPRRKSLGKTTSVPLEDVVCSDGDMAVPRKPLLSVDDILDGSHDSVDGLDLTIQGRAKRSQSTGSIDILSDDMLIDGATGHLYKPKKQKSTKGNQKSFDGGNSKHDKSKSKIFTKWERVKKVFSGKPGEHGSKLSSGHHGNIQGTVGSLVVNPIIPHLDGKRKGWEERAACSEASPNVDSFPFLTPERSPEVKVEGNDPSTENVEIEVIDYTTSSILESENTQYKLSSSIAGELRKTSSDEVQRDMERMAKANKTAWGRVKEIIHTRRDSLKRRSKNLDIEVYSDAEISPRSSPKPWRKALLTTSDSPKMTSPARTPQGSPKNTKKTDTLGAVSNDFNKKLQQWEEMKSKKIQKDNVVSTKAEAVPDLPHMDLATNLSDDFKEKLEQWNRKKHSAPSVKTKPFSLPVSVAIDTLVVTDTSLDGSTVQDSQHSPDGQHINLDTLQRNLSESFNRKMEEWERRKYRRDTSLSPERKNVDKNRSKSNKTTKSKGVHEERGRTKFRTRHKLRKERSKTLDRKIDLYGNDREAEVVIETENGVYKVSEDFAQKLQEWESIKQTSPLKTPNTETSGDDELCPSQGIHQEVAVQTSCNDSLPDELNDVDRLLEDNNNLKNQLRQKEQEYIKVKTELRKSKQKLLQINRTKSGSTDAGELKKSVSSFDDGHHEKFNENVLGLLRDKLYELEETSEKLANEKQDIETRALRGAELWYKTEAQLLDEICQLKSQINVQVCTNRRSNPNIDQFCEYALKLHNKLQEMKVGVLERNKVISEMKKTLIMHEVSNVLMAADACRHLSQLTYYQKMRGHTKRRRTFAGIQQSDESCDPEIERMIQRYLRLKNTCNKYDNVLEQLQGGDFDVVEPDWLKALDTPVTPAMDDETQTDDICTIQSEAKLPHTKQSDVQSNTKLPDRFQKQFLYKPLTEFEKFRERERVRKGSDSVLYSHRKSNQSWRKISDTSCYESISKYSSSREADVLDKNVTSTEDRSLSPVGVSTPKCPLGDSTVRGSISSGSSNDSYIQVMAGGSDADRSTSVSSVDRSVYSCGTNEDSAAILSSRATRERARKMREEVLLMRKLSDTSDTVFASPKIIPKTQAELTLENKMVTTDSDEEFDALRPKQRKRSTSAGSQQDMKTALWFNNPRNKEKVVPVHEIIHRFESNSSTCSDTKKTTNTLHYDSMAPVRSPVMRLKSATELLQDSQTKRHVRLMKSDVVKSSVYEMEKKSTIIKESRSCSTGRSSAKVQELVRKLSRESTPERSRSLTNTPTRSLSPNPRPYSYPCESFLNKCRKMSCDLIEEPVHDIFHTRPPLKDLTSEKRVQKLRETFRSAELMTRTRGDSPETFSRSRSEQAKLSRSVSPEKVRRMSREQPRDGTVLKNMEIFEHKKTSDTGSQPRSPSPDVVNQKQTLLKHSCETEQTDNDNRSQRVSKSSEKFQKDFKPKVTTTSKRKTESSKFCCSHKTDSLPSNQSVEVNTCDDITEHSDVMGCHKRLTPVSSDASSSSISSSTSLLSPKVLQESNKSKIDDNNERNKNKKSWLGKPKRFFKISKC